MEKSQSLEHSTHINPFPLGPIVFWKECTGRCLMFGQCPIPTSEPNHPSIFLGRLSYRNTIFHNPSFQTLNWKKKNGMLCQIWLHWTENGKVGRPLFSVLWNRAWRPWWEEVLERGSWGPHRWSSPLWSQWVRRWAGEWRPCVPGDSWVPGGKLIRKLFLYGIKSGQRQRYYKFNEITWL